MYENENRKEKEREIHTLVVTKREVANRKRKALGAIPTRNVEEEKKGELSTWPLRDDSVERSRVWYK